MPYGDGINCYVDILENLNPMKLISKYKFNVCPSISLRILAQGVACDQCNAEMQVEGEGGWERENMLDENRVSRWINTK